MDKKQPSKKEAMELLCQLSKRAFQNGEELIQDARTIINENNSYGHAFGLLVLAEEEFAKACIFHTIHEMVRNDFMWPSEDKKAPKISKIISDHNIKQNFLKYLWKLYFFFENKSNLPTFERLTVEESVEMLSKLLEEIENPTDEESITIIKQFEPYFQSMQNDREISFYVGIGSKHNILAPSDITKSKCIKQFSKTNFSLTICKIWCSMIIKDLNHKEMAILNKFKKKIYEGND